MEFDDLPPINYDEIVSLGSQEHDFYDPGLPLIENVAKAFERSVLLPKPEIQLPILAAFTCLPTALLKISPMLCVVGRSGSGKSQIGKIIAAINGTEPIGSNSTFASIKNIIKEISTLDDMGEFKAPNYCLVFDDAKVDFVEDADRFALMRYGYDKKTSVITIAGPVPGSVLRFETFCPKVFSTTETFIFEAQYAELRRRCLLVRTEKQSDNPLVDDLVPPEEMEYRTLRRALRHYWSVLHNCEHFMGVHAGMRRSRAMFSTDQWTIYRPISSVLSCLYEINSDEAKEIGKAFFDAQIDEETPLQQLLKDNLSPHMELVDELIASGSKTASYFVPGSTIKHLVETAKKNGLIPDSRLEAYNPEMEALGWRLRKNNIGDIEWGYGN